MPVFKNIGPFVFSEDLVIVDTVTVDGTTTGTPVNVSGWNGTFTLWSRKEDAAPVYSTSFTVGIGSDGKLTANLLLVTTSTLSDRAYWFSFRRTDGGQNAVVSEGTITFMGG